MPDLHEDDEPGPECPTCDAPMEHVGGRWVCPFAGAVGRPSDPAAVPARMTPGFRRLAEAEDGVEVSAGGPPFRVIGA